VKIIPPIIRKKLHRLRLRYRFPGCVTHSGVSVDAQSHLGVRSVIFENVQLIDTKLGGYSYIQSDSKFVCAEVGRFCSIASNVIVGLARHPTSFVSTSPVFYDPNQPLPHFFVESASDHQSIHRTTIGSDVWIGEGVKILGGVTIGTGAVIGAGAIVTKDIEPYAIAVGVPCKEIAKRFDADLCRRLLDSCWWEMTDNEFETLGHLFAQPLDLLEALAK